MTRLGDRLTRRRAEKPTACAQVSSRETGIIMFPCRGTRWKYQSHNDVVYFCKHHVIWCPKYRRPVLVPEVAERKQEGACLSLASAFRRLLSGSYSLDLHQERP